MLYFFFFNFPQLHFWADANFEAEFLSLKKVLQEKLCQQGRDVGPPQREGV
jgi:hypothetical protein